MRTHLTSLTINLTKLVEARNRQKSELEREILEKKLKVAVDANKEKELLKNKMKLETTLEKEAKKDIKILEKNISKLEKDIRKVEGEIDKAKKKHLSQLSKENKMIADAARKGQIVSSQRQNLEEKTKQLEMQIKQKEEIKDLKSQFLRNMSKDPPFYLPDPVPYTPKAPILQNPAYHQLPNKTTFSTDHYNYLISPLPPQNPNYNCHNIYNNNNSFGSKNCDIGNQAPLRDKFSGPQTHQSFKKDPKTPLGNNRPNYNYHSEVFRKMRYDFNQGKNVWTDGYTIKDYNVTKSYEMPKNLDPSYNLSEKFYPNINIQEPHLQRASNYLNKSQNYYLSNTHVNEEYERLNQKYNSLPRNLPFIQQTNRTNHQNYTNKTNNHQHLNVTNNHPPVYPQHHNKDHPFSYPQHHNKDHPSSYPQQPLNRPTNQPSLNRTNNQTTDPLPPIPTDIFPDQNAPPPEENAYDEILPDEYLVQRAEDYENADEENYISHFKLVRILKKGCYGDVCHLHCSNLEIFFYFQLI